MIRNLLGIWIRRAVIREIIALPGNGTRSVEDSRMAAWTQLADEIRAQGSGADHGAANCLRAYMPKPFAPPRPKHPPKAVE